MVDAVKAAKESATKSAILLSHGGWVRLARMASFTIDEKRYVIAGRLLGENGSHGAEIGCSCPDWVFRKRGTKELCKHQREFLNHTKGTTPTNGIWMYKSGISFQKSMATPLEQKND